jgi:hypothetical protein
MIQTPWNCWSSFGIGFSGGTGAAATTGEGFIPGSGRTAGRSAARTSTPVAATIIISIAAN